MMLRIWFVESDIDSVKAGYENANRKVTARTVKNSFQTFFTIASNDYEYR
jgi:hypothetical protein